MPVCKEDADGLYHPAMGRAAGLPQKELQKMYVPSDIYMGLDLMPPEAATWREEWTVVVKGPLVKLQQVVIELLHASSFAAGDGQPTKLDKRFCQLLHLGVKGFFFFMVNLVLQLCQMQCIVNHTHMLLQSGVKCTKGL